jgi:hypothetical protein
MTSVMVPPVAIVGIDWPAAFEVETPESERGIEAAADDATCKLTEAKAPLETTPAFIPKTRHVIDPAAFTHESDLPAADAAAPTDALIEVTLAAGKLSVQLKADGCAPLLDVNETGTETVAPGALVAEPTLKATF